MEWITRGDKKIQMRELGRIFKISWFEGSVWTAVCLEYVCL